MSSEKAIESFGAALEAFGTSALNPNNLQNNCVSVSLAHMHGYSTVNELWAATYGHSLKGDRPLQIPQIVDLLKRTGYQYTWRDMTPSGDRNKLDNPKGVRQLIFDSFPGYHDECAIALYRRADTSGHAVNIEVSVPDWKVPMQLSFKDYQHSTSGYVDVWSDIKNAVNVKVLYLGPRLSSTSDAKFQSDVARMKKAGAI